MFPNQAPPPLPGPGAGEGQEPSGFWVHHTPMGVFVTPGPPPPGFPGAPDANAAPPSAPQGLPPLQPFMIPIVGPPPGFGIPPPSTTPGQPPAGQQQPAPQQQQGGHNYNSEGFYQVPGMGPLAPLPKGSQDPNNPATLPPDYYAYRDKGTPAPALWKMEKK